jgi:soluble lytic murein transglycosylase
MFKQRKLATPLALGAGLLIGMGLLALIFQTQLRSLLNPTSRTDRPTTPDQRLAQGRIPAQSTSDHFATLQDRARTGQGLDRNRARYQLAALLLQNGQTEAALPLLHGLEQDYPTLAPYILVKRAQAYTRLGDLGNARATWQDLSNRYPDDPAVVEAWFELGQQQPRYWDAAIATFPAHPRTVEWVQRRLTQNPKQPQLLLLLARHGLYLDNSISILDQLVSRYSQQLQPQDWAAIAFGYWEQQQYRKAGKAYAKAPKTSKNLYRVGRGLQLGEQKGEAKQAYRQLIQTFPTAGETGLALMRLAALVEPAQRIPYFDQVIQKFPQRAAAALLAKAQVLEKTQPQVAAQIQSTLLKNYSTSDAAAELRWTLARQHAKAENQQAAQNLAQQITTHNPDSEWAAEATFWVGKWAVALGRGQEAQDAYKRVLERYPDSYYAWRSATALGWNVGDFKTVRSLNPCAGGVCFDQVAPQPLQLMAGSDTLKELYALGQDREAWERWQVEFKNVMEPTVAEQFTDGILRQGVGDYLNGIFMVSFLSQRETPTERSQVQALKQTADYWHALYPLPYVETIATWSKARNLNPWLVTGLMRQESRFEVDIRSSAGAVGLMQVMPETGDWIANQIKLKTFNLENPVDNIKLGTWYLDYTHDEYQNNSMLAIASYNAGPGNVSSWVKRLSLNDPDQFVEAIPFDETRGYVKAVFGNYWNYHRLYDPSVSKQLAQYSSTHQATKINKN